MIPKMSLLLFALATVVVAHPMPHLGGKGGLSPEGFPCMEGIKPPREFMQAIEMCFAKTATNMKTLLKGYKTDAPTRKMIEEIIIQRDEVFAECMIDRLGYENRDGSLNVTRIIKEGIEQISAPNLMMRVRVTTMAKMCAENVTGFNASQQFINFNSCLQQSIVDFCDQEMNYLEMFLDRDSTKSVCSPVGNYLTGSEIDKVVAECKAEAETKIPYGTASDPRGDGGPARWGGHRGHAGIGPHRERGPWQNKYKNEAGERNRAIEKTAATIFCVAGKLGFYSNDTGYNFTAFRDILRNLPGWEGIPNVLESVTREYDSCPQKYYGDHVMQGYRWETCLMPKIVDLCGLDNNVTSTLFPLRTFEISQAAKMFARHEIGLRNDDDVSDSLPNVYESIGDSAEGRWPNRYRERRSKNSGESEEDSSGSMESDEVFGTLPPEPTTLAPEIMP